MSQLSPEQKTKILAYVDLKISGSEISRILKLPISTVNKLIAAFKKNGTVARKKSKDKNKKLLPEIKADILKQINENPKTSLRKIEKKIKSERGISISYNTVRNCLVSENIFSFSPIKKPLLRPAHIKKRFEVSRELLKMPEKKAKTIIFSDESKFNLFYSDGVQYVWRKPSAGLESKNLAKTIKGNGGSVMVWACFSYAGIGKIQIIDGNMNGAMYVDILSRNLFESAEKMKLKTFLFQQDNDPKHTSRISKEFFIENDINVIDWPAQSPDLNPIEHLWAWVKIRVAERMPKNLNDLKRFIVEEWERIPKAVCEKYALSFKNRAMQIYKALGEHTYY